MKKILKITPAILGCATIISYASSMSFYGGMETPKNTVAKIAGINVQPRTIIAKSEKDVAERGDDAIKSSGNTDRITNVISYKRNNAEGS